MVALRILIVEDDKHIRRILESLVLHESTFATHQPEVTVAQDGEAGLAALDNGPFDLVVSDLLMPRMDGFAFCRALRQHRFGAQVPLIVTSAVYKDQAAIDRLRADTGAEFFAKPFEVRELMVAIRRIIDAHPVDSAATREGTAPPRPVEPHGLPASGTLTERGAPRLLLDLWEQRATGVLTIVRGKVRKELALLHGTPVSADSNLRTETLGHFLVSRGILDEQRHQTALQRAQNTNDRLGRVLVELGWISEKDLLSQLAAQMRAKITAVLRWQDGDWQFALRDPPADRLQTPVETPRLVFVGLQKTAHVDEIAQLLMASPGRVGLTLRAERLREPFVRVHGAAGLEALARRPLLKDLMAGVNPAPLMLQLDALLLCGMAEFEPAGETAADSPTENHADPMTLARIAQPPPPVDAPLPKTLYDELFGDEPSLVHKLAAGGLEEELKLPTAAAPSPPPPDPTVEALRNEVLGELLALHGKDHYQVLGLPRGASVEAVRAAYAEKLDRFRLERFSDVDLGPEYARVEELQHHYQRALKELTTPAARTSYDQALARRDAVSHAPFAAEVLAQSGQVLLDEGDAQGARAKLAEAVAAAPEQADYHALLGWATFLASGGESNAAADAAWGHLRLAFAIDGEHVAAHEYAGRICVATNDDERAVPHLERVLDADPGRTEALAALETAQSRRGEWHRLEHRYRKLIHRLTAAGRPPATFALWLRLADLYSERLDDRASARMAYETAAKLSPEDPRPREALARLHQQAPTGSRVTAPSLREAWRLMPDDPKAGRALFELQLGAERWDAAFVAAGALLSRGGADDGDGSGNGAGEFYRRWRPRFLPRAPVALDAELVAKLRHSDEDPLLSELFGRVFSALAPAFSLADLGVSAEDQIAHDRLPEPFFRVLAYVAHQLGVSAPAVHRRSDFAADVHVGAGQPPLLLAGPRALALSDRTALAFRLGRALTYLWPGRAAIGALPPKGLKDTLFATMTLAAPGLRVDDPDGTIAQLRAQLALAAPTLPQEVAPLVDQLQRKVSLNLSRFTRGLARTADRIGLLLAGDLPTAARIVADEGAAGAAEDLVDFALSDDHLLAREALGISIAV